MAATGFRALMLRKDGDRISHAFEQLPVDELPPGDVLVSVAYSTVNYKDGLALKGAPGVIRNYPMIPGIDLSGTVVESASSWFKPCDRVVATGAWLGEIH